MLSGTIIIKSPVSISYIFHESNIRAHSLRQSLEYLKYIHKIKKHGIFCARLRSSKNANKQGNVTQVQFRQGVLQRTPHTPLPSFAARLESNTPVLRGVAKGGVHYRTSNDLRNHLANTNMLLVALSVCWRPCIYIWVNGNIFIHSKLAVKYEYLISAKFNSLKITCPFQFRNVVIYDNI